MTMHKYTVTVISAISIVVSGCTPLAQSNNKSKQYAVQGCAAGGMATGLITFAIKYGDSDATEKSLIAAMLGCTAGAVVGYQVGKRTDAYIDAQDAAQSEITRNGEETQRLQQYNLQLAQNIEDYNKQIDMIKTSRLSEQEKLNDLESAHEVITRQLEKTNDSLAKVEADIAEAQAQYIAHQNNISPQDMSNWQAKLASYETEKEILADHVNTLNALDASI